jgi:small-conductance mechanosensitive channel
MDYFIQTGFVFGNHIALWALSVLVFVGVFMLSVTARRVVTERLSGQANSSQALARAVTTLLQSTHRFFIFAVALGLAKQLLVLPGPVDRIVRGIVLVATLIQVGMWAGNVATALIDRQLRLSHKRDPASAGAAQIIRVSCLAVVWSAILLMGLSNFGIDITGLVAGLGVGGIAVAFALQSVLKDLFASLAIILDKPFVVGDFIIFDDQLGTVERIGLKTTRVRSLSGEQISVSNDALLATRLRNFKRMEERRVVFSLVTHFGAPADMLEEFPCYMRSTIEGIEGVRFDRSHLAEITETGLRFETVYYVLSPDYNIYMDIHQRILVSAARWFERNGLQFAHPTRRLLFGPQDMKRAAAVSTPKRTDIRALS